MAVSRWLPRTFEEQAPQDAYRHIHQAADSQLTDTQLGVSRWLRFLAESVSLGVLARLWEEGTDEAIMEAIPFEAFGDGLRTSLETNLTEVLDRAGTLALRVPPTPNAYLGLRFDVTNPEATLWASQHAAERVVQVTQETRLAIRGIVRASYTEQYTPLEQARRIKGVIGLTRMQAQAITRYSEGLRQAGHSEKQVERLRKLYHQRSVNYRAETIARTETINASVAGQQQLWGQAVRAGNLSAAEWIQEWVVTQDDRTCPRCRPLSGQRARLGESFPDDGSGPTLHPRCRCAVVLRRIASQPYKPPLPGYNPTTGTLAPRAPALRRSA